MGIAGAIPTDLLDWIYRIERAEAGMRTHRVGIAARPISVNHVRAEELFDSLGKTRNSSFSALCWLSESIKFYEQAGSGLTVNFQTIFHRGLAPK
jgi:hypothetical protein